MMIAEDQKKSSLTKSDSYPYHSRENGGFSVLTIVYR
jgi:hypothetical protein